MPPPSQETRRRQLILAAAYIVNVIGVATTLYSSPLYWKQEYHTSKLTGIEWVEELVVGHPDRIRTELGMSVHVFLMLVEELRSLCYLTDAKYVTLKEQVAIFLYMSVTGLSIRHVGERFQCSNETISVYFRKILDALSSGPFYGKYVRLPTANDPVPDYIKDQPKFSPWFDMAIGAMDGTHINCCPSAEERHSARNHKGGISQNCLACVAIPRSQRAAIWPTARWYVEVLKFPPSPASALLSTRKLTKAVSSAEVQIEPTGIADRH